MQVLNKRELSHFLELWHIEDGAEFSQYVLREILDSSPGTCEKEHFYEKCLALMRKMIMVGQNHMVLQALVATKIALRPRYDKASRSTRNKHCMINARIQVFSTGQPPENDQLHHEFLVIDASGKKVK